MGKRQWRERHRALLPRYLSLPVPSCPGGALPELSPGSSGWAAPRQAPFPASLSDTGEGWKRRALSILHTPSPQMTGWELTITPSHFK